MSLCDTCGGSCCKFLIIPLPSWDADVVEWFSYHGKIILLSGIPRWIRLDVRCDKLGPDNRCTIYDQRPEVCRRFKPGSHNCRDAVEYMKTKEDHKQQTEVQHEG